MKLSTKGRYSVTALYHIALAYGKGPVSLKSISERQGVSYSYLGQLFITLKKAGFVKSVRGAQGGYVLTRPPEEITIGEIIVATEGPITLVECMLSPGATPPCINSCDCATRDIWAKIGDKLNDVLNSISLADLCHDKAIKEGCIAK